MTLTDGRRTVMSTSMLSHSFDDHRCETESDRSTLSTSLKAHLNPTQRNPRNSRHEHLRCISLLSPLGSKCSGPRRLNDSGSVPRSGSTHYHDSSGILNAFLVPLIWMAVITDLTDTPKDGLDFRLMRAPQPILALHGFG